MFSKVDVKQGRREANGSVSTVVELENYKVGAAGEWRFSRPAQRSQAA